MKKLLTTTFLCTFAAVTVFAELSNQDLTKALDDIRKRNNPRYLVYNDQKIVDECLDFAKANTLTPEQRIMFNRKLVDSAALLDDMTVYSNAIAEIRACTNDRLRVSTLSSLISSFSHLYAGSKKWTLAEAEYDTDPSIFNVIIRMNHNTGFAINKARLHDLDGFRQRLQAILDEKPDKPEDVANPASSFNKNRSRCVLDAINACLEFDREEAEKLFEQQKKLFDENQINAFYNALAKTYVATKDRKHFDTILNGVKAYPLQKRVAPYCEILKQLHQFDPKLARKLIETELVNTELKPAQRMTYLALKQWTYEPQIFNYGFNEPGQYETYRNVLRERIALMDANKDDPDCNVLKDHAYRGMVDVMIWFDDLAFAEELIVRKLAAEPENRDILQRQAQVRGIRGNANDAAASLMAMLNTPRCPASVTNDVLPIVAFLKGQGISGFDKAIAPRELNTAGRLETLRKTSKELFKMRRYADCRMIVDEIYTNMYRQEKPRVCTATYYANAPKSADGFVRTPLYNDWNAMTTEFKVYGDGYSESATTDEKRHLKDAVQPDVDPAYRTGVRVIYDEEGVHVFVRCDDPNIADVKLGKRTAGGLEFFLRPGDAEKPYHSIFFTDLPGTSDPHAAEWAMPGRNYRRTTDTFTKDAALTADGSVAHISIPWISFYDSLPIDGNAWRLGVIRETPVGMQTIGGIVHELSRGLYVTFALSQKQLVELKRNVATMAFNRYKKIRHNEGDFLLTWNDAVLGDPDFYTSEVAPLVEKLDKAGEQLLKPASEKEVDAIYRDIVPLWAEINYEIAARRTRYLNDKLFEE